MNTLVILLWNSLDTCLTRLSANLIDYFLRMIDLLHDLLLKIRLCLPSLLLFLMIFLLILLIVLLLVLLLIFLLLHSFLDELLFLSAVPHVCFDSDLLDLLLPLNASIRLFSPLLINLLGSIYLR